MNDEIDNKKPFPGLCYHKFTRRFYVLWEKRFYFWPTDTSRAVAQSDHDAMRDAYETAGTFAFLGRDGGTARTVDALIDAYLARCDSYYAVTPETVGNVERAMRPLHARFGKRPMDSFGPRMLRQLRDDMLERGWTRKVINARVQHVVRMFKWGASEELVKASVYEALRTVEGLRMGRTKAPEGPGRRPVAWEHVEPVLQHVSREVAAMLVIQATSGCRPGEVVQMRPVDIDRSSAKVWAYRPPAHKTQHLGKSRLIPLFADAQRALEPFLNRVPAVGAEEPLFSPRRAEEERRLKRRIGRRSPVQPSQAAREENRKSNERLCPPRDRYDVNAYARAVRRGVEAANGVRVREAVAGALGPLVPEAGRVRLVGMLKRIPNSVTALVGGADGPGRDREEAQLRKVIARVARRLSALKSLGVRLDAAAMLPLALRAIEALSGKLIPFWTPYQLRHRFATEGEAKFGEAAVSLAMGHASLRMTEHYVDRNLKAVFERMAEQG